VEKEIEHRFVWAVNVFPGTLKLLRTNTLVQKYFKKKQVAKKNAQVHERRSVT